MARACVEMASEYARTRTQFGRVIAMFQAVKHHCANMAVAAELATAATWDAGRASAAGGDEFTYAAAAAAALALHAADLNANLNTQVHGGIGITWEHDAHLYMRRATALESLVDAEAAAADVVRALPRRRPADPLGRAAARGRGGCATRSEQIVAQVKDLDEAGPPHRAGRHRLRDAVVAEAVGPRRRCRRAARHRGGVQRRRHQAAELQHHRLGHPHPHPARDRRSRSRAGCGRRSTRSSSGASSSASPTPGPTPPASRPAPPRSTAAGLINGQKVWTSGAHLAGFGFATVRTNPDAPKHQGITTMVIDMKAHGRHRPAAEDDDRRVGVQRGLLRRRLHPGRRRGRPDRRRLDRRPRHARQRERQHRRRPGRHGRSARAARRLLRQAPGPAAGRRAAGSGGTSPAPTPPRR